MPNRLFRIAFAAVLSLACALPAAAAHADTNVLFILDASGSMWAKVDGKPKIVTARAAMKQVLKDLPKGTQLGLMSYGHRKKGDCSDIELISPIGTTNAAAISKKIDALQPKGETPIADALKTSASAFDGKKGPKMVVLVTDGAEECHGDPCAAAKALVAADVDVHINVVGFNLGDTERKAVQCIADEGHGHYYDAANSKSLTSALTEVKEQVVQVAQAATPVSDATPTPPPVLPAPDGVNLLSPKEGGHIVAAPDDKWGVVVTGTDKDYRGTVPPQEITFAFKDGKPATFSKFQLEIPSQTNSNVKTFELFTADTLTGDYKSLGQFTAQNILLMKSPYQEFTFPETTARYFKFKVIDNYGAGLSDGGSTGVYQIRLVGKVDDSAIGAPPAPSHDGLVNLLDAKQGGQLIAAPDPKWAAIITGKDADGLWTAVPQNSTEAVFGFKDEKLATFSSFAIRIPDTEGTNVKDFELLAADDSPTGTFRSLGTFTAQNVLFTDSPYQEFTFPATTAKYLKFKVTSNDGAGLQDWGNLHIYQIRLWGKMADASAAASAAATAAPAATEVNLLDPKLGGQTIAAPNPKWAAVITGKDADAVWTNTNADTNNEVVFAFKDEKPATFSKFAIRIPDTEGTNVKDFEIFAADDSPTGTFRSLGKFTTQNMLMMKSPYQEFTFPETTAKYIKVKLISNFGAGLQDWGNMHLYQIKVLGKQG